MIYLDQLATQSPCEFALLYVVAYFAVSFLILSWGFGKPKRGRER